MAEPPEQSWLDETLEAERRQRVEARMLPSEGSLTDTQRASVRRAVTAYCETHGITHKSVGKQCALSGGTISEVITGSSKISSDKIDAHLRTINEWMENDARRRRSRPDDTFVETLVAKRLLQCAQKAADMVTMALAHGPTGIGKSMVAHVIAERFPGAIYIRISAGTSAFYKLRQMLAQRLRLYGRRRPKKDDTPGLTLDERIFEKLKGSHRLLIIDEAHRISDSALEFLRDVHDECQVPVLLLCTKDLRDRIRKDNDEDHGQLYSRVGYIRDLVKGKDKVPGGKNPLFTLAEIRKLFDREQVRLAADGAQHLQDVANTLGQGSLRLCRDLLRWAVALERRVRKLGPRDRVTISAQVLRTAEAKTRDDDAMLDDMAYRHAAPPAEAVA